MQMPHIDRTPHRKFPNLAAVAEHNRQLARKIATRCSTMEEVDILAIEVSGHLSHKECTAFRELAWSTWFDYNVAKICAEVAGE